jgi:hypothetical protein
MQTYENGTININDDIEFSMRNTCKQITHYILSRYMGKLTDEIGRRRPFRNIGNAIVDLKWRAKNIDRKSIVTELVEREGSLQENHIIEWPILNLGMLFSFKCNVRINPPCNGPVLLSMITLGV